MQMNDQVNSFDIKHMLHKEGFGCYWSCRISLSRASGLVPRKLKDERRGQWVYYSLNPLLPDWAKRIIESTSVNLMKEEPYSSDIRKICSLKKEAMCKP